MKPHALSALCGYDPRLLDRLPPRARRSLSRVSEAWLSTCGLLGGAVAHAVHGAERNLVVATGFGTGAFALALAVIRLSVAGGGAPAHAGLRGARTYEPGWAPTGVLLALAVLLSGAAQLSLFLTAGYALLVTLPALWGRFAALDALRAYEVLRFQQRAAGTARHARACLREAQRELRRFDTYEDHGSGEALAGGGT